MRLWQKREDLVHEDVQIVTLVVLVFRILEISGVSSIPSPSDDRYQGTRSKILGFHLSSSLRCCMEQDRKYWLTCTVIIWSNVDLIPSKFAALRVPLEKIPGSLL